MGKDAEFLDAARNGNVQLVEKYLSTKLRRSGPLASLRRGPGANVQDSSGYTALHHASLNGHRSVVSLLLRHEASVNMQDDKGSSALHLAAWAGHAHVTKVLLQQGPSLPQINHQNKGGDTALHCAAQYGHTDTARLLLQYGANPTLPNLKAETPLDLAAQFGRLSIAELLVKEAHHDLLKAFNAQSATAAVFPHTPLHLASRNGHLAVVKLLLNHGHHVNVRTSIGSPLHEAAICGKVDVVRALMEAGGDPDVKNDLGNTVLDTIASINTVVTQQISAIIRSHHSRLIEIEPDEVAEEGDESAPPNISFEFNISSSPPEVSSFISDHSGSPTSFPSATSTISLSSLERPSSAPITFRSTFVRSDFSRSSAGSSLRSGHSASPSSFPQSSFPPSYFGSPYENVLVPTAATPPDGENPMRALDRRVIKRGLREKTERRNLRPRTDREKDLAGRLSDRDTGRVSDSGRLSDYDGLNGRRSIASDYLSIYDVPPPTKRASASDRSSISTRSSSTHDILDDDNEYDIPPPPRGVYLTKELSVDGDLSNKPLPPPKPPRRSVCPPSPAEKHDDGSYEMICFASSGKHKSGKVESETVSSAKEGKTDRGREFTFEKKKFVLSEVHYKTLGHVPSRSKKQRHFSSDSDSDCGQHKRENKNSGNKNRYTSMTFKPIKSHRTSKPLRIYENTSPRYENASERHHRSPKRHHESKSLQRSHTTGQPRSEKAKATLELSESQLSSRLAVTSDDSEDDGRPRSLNCFAKRTTPRSPTYYHQPPTPDHPPPSAKQAQSFIVKKMKQVSQDHEVIAKRSSRDAETETEPEESSQVPTTGPESPLRTDQRAASSASGNSYSDRSGSSDNIEEVTKDTPFTGLFRGCRVSGSEEGVLNGEEVDALMLMEHSRSLSAYPFREFEKVDRGGGEVKKTFKAPTDAEGGCDKGTVLSPLEEDEEWARISDIMASFGGGLTRESVFMAELEQEFQQKLGMSLSPSQYKVNLLQQQTSTSSDNSERLQKDQSESELENDLSAWLQNHGFSQYEYPFISQGYDHLHFLNGLLEDSDLQEIGICDSGHRNQMVSLMTQLPNVIATFSNRQFENVEEWLTAISLPEYLKVFLDHGYADMDRIRKIWEVELTVVLEVTSPGHRRRMLASLGDRPIEPELPPSLAPQDLSLELSKLNTDISELKEKLFNELPPSTSRERRTPESTLNTIKKNISRRRVAPPPPPKAPRAPRAQPSIDMKEEDPLESSYQLALRDPSELVAGIPLAMLTHWKHNPSKLLESTIDYCAQYLGSTYVKELRGPESTLKSIHKLKRSTAEGAKLPRIVLAISYRGVRFIDAETNNMVCEHEIQNIHCACQDSEHLSHFAYITKDTKTRKHYCHVFRVEFNELAAEIIMTLGEAFEVAYQLAMRQRQLLANQSDEQKLAQGHGRAESEGVRGSFISNFRSSSSSASGTTAPQSSLENLLGGPSDSGNYSDKDPSEKTSDSSPRRGDGSLSPPNFAPASPLRLPTSSKGSKEASFS